MNNLQFKLIKPLEYKKAVIKLLKFLNPKMNKNNLEDTLIKMTEMPNYKCFALFQGGKLIGISGGWTTVRIYCGKQLELDNVVIDSQIQSKGFGKYFINAIKQWTIRNNYNSLELNTYVENSRSHKFYYNEGFKILGFHFEHKLNT